MLQLLDGRVSDAPLSSELPQWHSELYSRPAYCKPLDPQKSRHIETVIELEEVLAPVRALPDEPSATQVVDAAVQPVGKMISFLVRSWDRVLTAMSEAKRVRDDGPPQIADGPPAHGMLHVLAVLSRDAP
jgi:hypothetical protein